MGAAETFPEIQSFTSYIDGGYRPVGGAEVVLAKTKKLGR